MQHRLTRRSVVGLAPGVLLAPAGIDPLRIHLIPASPPSALPARALGDEELRAEVDGYLAQLAAADAFSGAVRIARRGEPIYEGAYGLADKAAKLPNAVDTKFNLGSMNKMFTAVAIAQLVEQGKLGFDDPLAKALPDYPNREVAEQVTIHHLLTHTSGLGDIFTPAFFEDTDRYREPRDYFPLFANQPLLFAPGAHFSYSNAGFVVLGAVVERASGGSYYDYVPERVYGPAGMTDTDSYERDATVPNLAIGYTASMEPNTATLPYKGSPAGGGYSTVGDLTRFHAALWGNTLLGPDLVERVTTGVVEAPPEPGTKYGYGFVDDRSGSARVVSHGGGAPGISANLDMYPDRDLAVAVLSNYDRAARTVAIRIRGMVAP